MGIAQSLVAVWAQKAEHENAKVLATVKDQVLKQFLAIQKNAQVLKNDCVIILNNRFIEISYVAML